jgi:gliding motility-associated-like protein
VWECEKDGAGNVYIIGGVNPMQLLKYNAAGAIQWTYSTPYDTSAWLGTFATDNAGNSYVTQGSVAQIVKVNTAGAVVWNNTSPGGLFASTEFWNITFNCDQTKLVIGGTGNTLPPQPYVYEMNMATGNVTSSIKVTGGALIPTQEVRSIAPCGNGRYYFLTHDTIGYLNQNFTACSSPSQAIHKNTNSYSLGYKCENFRYDNSGIMAIKANTSFVYTNRGNQLDKRSLATGAILTSVAIPGGGFSGGLGGNSVQNSGIDIYDCGNVYVGSKNAVIKFDANLVQLASYPTTYNVYDVHVTTGGNIIACGSTGTSSTASRTGTIEYINAGACATITLTCCDVNICQPPNVCSTAAAFNLQAATAGGTWSGAGITNATTGTFNPAVAGVGSFVITYSLACGVGTTTINVNTCGTVTLCANSGSLTANGGSGTYSWASTSTSVSCASCPGGNCIPFICAGTTVPTWTASGTTVTAPAAGIFPITVKDVSTGTTFTFSTLASIPTCSTTSCPTLALAVTSQTNVNCFGASTGTATINASGGASPYTYTWTPGALTGASQTGLAAGTYTIAIKDANSCTGTGTVTITQPTAAISAVISATSTTGCGTSTGGATVTASGGTPSYSYSWSPSGGTTAGVSNLASGNNTVTVTDIKGCTVTAVANITTVGGPTLSVASQTNVNCFGANTGTATINAVGGTGPYSYTWTPGNLSGASQTTLSAGTYTVNVKDANLCTSSITLAINQPTAAVSAVISATSTTGCGVSTGGATVTASGGTPSYSYSWSPSGGTTAGVSNLASGNNTVTVTDIKGCTVTAVANITSAGGPTLSVASQTNVNCFGASTGTATINAVGGTGPYSYTWTPGNLSGASQTGLGAGTYTVNVKDANLCASSTTLTITQPTSAISAVVSATTTTGCGTSTGGATVTASGGTPTYSYSWSPSGGTTVNVSNLAAGNNTVLVTDIKGCTVTAVANITTAGGPTLSITSLTAVNCYGANTGSASVIGNGGTGPYSYTWSPGNLSGSSQTSLASGVYTVNISDANLCAGSGTIYISQPTASLTGVISNTIAGGCGLSNGSASVTASGGTPSYTYSWSPNGGSSSSVSNLSSGTNAVTITDNKGCTTTVSVSITSISGPTLSVTSLANVKCFGTSTGTAAVSASGGTGPYTYTWSPGGLTGATQSSLAAGVYTISIADASSCTGTGTISISQPIAPLSVSISNTPTGCGTSVGSASATASGGTPSYSYTWTPSGGNTPIANGLATGNYSIAVTDSKGCVASASTFIGTTGGGPTLSIASQTNVLCNGGATGTASITASGSTGPYTYTWSPSGGNAPSATNLTAGTYVVAVKDAPGCTTTITLTITQPTAITLTVTTNAATCGNLDGSATVTSAGGTGALTNLWSTGSSSNTIVSLTAGSYSVSVKDANNCSASSVAVIGSTGSLGVNAGPSTTIFTGGSAVLTGSVPSGATVVWSPSSSLSCAVCTVTTASPNVTTTYTLTATLNGCIGSDTVTVILDILCGELFVPTAFSPNDDGQNDVLYVMGNCITNLEFVVFDRWGEKVFETKDPTVGWDGTLNGKKMNPAAFAYYLKATVKGVEVKLNGSFSLVK